MTDDQLSQIKANTEAAEGRVPWLYRDSGPEGRITTGVGHLVPDFAACQVLPFQPPITGAEWAQLLTEPRGCKAGFYQAVTKGRLSDSAIDDLLGADISAVTSALSSRLILFGTYPDGVQAALVDMAFNLGAAGLTKGYPKLMAAVQRQDWATCAAECHRNGISADRNKGTADLFLGVI